jgi:hypothetical protein
MPSERSPRLIGCQVAPASSLRKAPAEEIATKIRRGLLGATMIVCRHMPPAPGCQDGADGCVRSPGSSCHVWPPSVVRKSAASSTPAYTVSGSVRDGSRCHTFANSHGCGVPSYQRCVPVGPSYVNWLPTGSHVLPPSFERWITCPNQPLACEA